MGVLCMHEGRPGEWTQVHAGHRSAAPIVTLLALWPPARLHPLSPCPSAPPTLHTQPHHDSPCTHTLPSCSSKADAFTYHYDMPHHEYLPLPWWQAAPAAAYHAAVSFLRSILLLLVFAPVLLTAPVALSLDWKRGEWMELLRKTLEYAGVGVCVWGGDCGWVGGGTAVRVHVVCGRVIEQ